MAKKCKICGYKFKSNDEAICPECFTSREGNESCNRYSDDVHSHEHGIDKNLSKMNETKSDNDTFDEYKAEDSFVTEQRQTEFESNALRSTYTAPDPTESASTNMYAEYNTPSSRQQKLDAIQNNYHAPTAPQQPAQQNSSYIPQQIASTREEKLAAIHNSQMANDNLPTQQKSPQQNVNSSMNFNRTSNNGYRYNPNTTNPVNGKGCIIAILIIFFGLPFLGGIISVIGATVTEFNSTSHDDDTYENDYDFDDIYQAPDVSIDASIDLNPKNQYTSYGYDFTFYATELNINKDAVYLAEEVRNFVVNYGDNFEDYNFNLLTLDVDLSCYYDDRITLDADNICIVTYDENGAEIAYSYATNYDDAYATEFSTLNFYVPENAVAYDFYTYAFRFEDDVIEPIMIEPILFELDFGD